MVSVEKVSPTGVNHNRNVYGYGYGRHKLGQFKARIYKNVDKSFDIYRNDARK